MKNKSFVKITLIMIATLLILIGSIVIFVDPLFHFHKPISFFQYIIDDERYQNDGILKNFDYDAIITGTSYTENFKTSELDELFGTNAVKVPAFGSTFYELNQRLQTAFKHNKNIKLVVRSLDPRFLENKDKKAFANEDYPEYLYDENPFNDVEYVFNKEIIYKVKDVIGYTLAGKKTTSFDDYAAWSDYVTYGKDVVLSKYNRPEKQNEIIFTNEDKENVIESTEQNIVELAQNNPSTEFYLFLPPVSIVFFDELNQSGTLKQNFDAERVAIEILLKCENIHVYSFFDDFEMICDLNNYKDYAHYGGWINSYILECMYNGEYEITKNNIEDYYKLVEDFYLNYDYDSIFE